MSQQNKPLDDHARANATQIAILNAERDKREAPALEYQGDWFNGPQEGDSDD